MQPKPRILALDVGTKTIGIAVSDSAGWGGAEVETVRRRELGADCAAVGRWARDHEVAEIVIGLPLNMDGTEGPMARRVRAFGAALAAVLERPVPVVYWDERLTSWEAERRMREADLSRQRRKRKSHTMAALLILEDYLQNRKEPG